MGTMKDSKETTQAIPTATGVWTVEGMPTDDAGSTTDAPATSEAAGTTTYTPQAGWGVEETTMYSFEDVWRAQDTTTEDSDQVNTPEYVLKAEDTSAVHSESVWEEVGVKTPKQFDAMVDIEGDWPPYICLYEVGDPVLVEQIEEVILQFLKRPYRWQELQESKTVVRFIAGMSRIKPYCDEPAKEAIATMEAAWFCRARRSALQVECDIANAEAARLGRAIANRNAAAKSAAETGQEGKSSEGSGEHAYSERQGCDGLLTTTPVPVLVMDVPTQSAGETPSPATEAFKPFDFDTELPSSAWLVHSSKALRVLAASRYIKSFPLLKITLAQEPSLEKQARREALQLLYAGGQSNTDVGKQFMTAFIEQQDSERQEISSNLSQLTRSMNFAQTRAGQDCDDESDFNLSDGEEVEGDEEEMRDE